MILVIILEVVAQSYYIKWVLCSFQFKNGSVRLSWLYFWCFSYCWLTFLLGLYQNFWLFPFRSFSIIFLALFVICSTLLFENLINGSNLWWMTSHGLLLEISDCFFLGLLLYCGGYQGNIVLFGIERGWWVGGVDGQVEFSGANWPFLNRLH